MATVVPAIAVGLPALVHELVDEAVEVGPGSDGEELGEEILIGGQGPSGRAWPCSCKSSGQPPEGFLGEFIGLSPDDSIEDRYIRSPSDSAGGGPL
jgi:hypothetical protein